MTEVKRTYYLNEILDMAVRMRAAKDHMGYRKPSPLNVPSVSLLKSTISPHPKSLAAKGSTEMVGGVPNRRAPPVPHHFVYSHVHVYLEVSKCCLDLQVYCMKELWKMIHRYYIGSSIAIPRLLSPTTPMLLLLVPITP
jgi:hypothetical protein